MLVLAAEDAGGFQSNIPSIGSEELDGLPSHRLGETFPNQPVLKPDALRRLSVIQAFWKHPGRPHLIRPYQGREVQLCIAPILRGLSSPMSQVACSPTSSSGLSPKSVGSPSILPSRTFAHSAGLRPGITVLPRASALTVPVEPTLCVWQLTVAYRSPHDIIILQDRVLSKTHTN